MRNGKLSLNEALGEAGGPNLLTANMGQVYVIRNNAQGGPAIFHLNASAPSCAGTCRHFCPAPARRGLHRPLPLVNWNRIISLVWPTAQALNVTRQLVTP